MLQRWRSELSFPRPIVTSKTRMVIAHVHEIHLTHEQTFQREQVVD